MRATTRGLLGLLVLAPLSVLGATAYVTDNLRLGLHQAPDTSDRAFRYLDSGQEMEVLTRDRNYANVRLPDATEGWVKAAYLVDDKPAKLIVAEITAERDALTIDLEETRQAFAEPAATIETLRNDAASFDTEIGAANARIAELETQLADAHSSQAQDREDRP